MGTPNGFPHQEWSLDLSLLLLLAQRTDKSPILYNVNKNRYIFITQALSLPVALESTYKAPSVTLTYWCEQKRSTGLPQKKNPNLREI